MSASSNNYWLGGYWTAGRARGLRWHRGRWLGGQWEKGQWFSFTLQLGWKDTDIFKNDWSIWTGGTWRSNSQNRYSFDNYKILDEWSIWHGGRWQSEPYLNQDYTWQGKNVDSINIYGDTQVYAADINVQANTIRTILLPTARSIWLGGQWLRGVWEGGIFANGIWHSVPFSSVGFEILDDLHTLYQNYEYPIFLSSNDPLPPAYLELYNQFSILNFDNTIIPPDVIETLDTYVLFNESEIFSVSYEKESDYNEDLSEFHRGAFVNSVWEGGRVLDTSDDPYVTMFGMSISISSKKVFDDSGIQSDIGFLESNILEHTRYYGLSQPDWETYFINSKSNNQIRNQKILRLEPGLNDKNEETQYYNFADDMSSTGMYSVIWKRGKFQNGVFNYGQFYEYNVTNVVQTQYVSDPVIDTNFSDYRSVFEKGLFYKSIFNQGLFLAQYDKNDLLSSFSRSLWLSGYWAALSDKRFIDLPYDTDIRFVTNSRFWKSIWMNGIWEGGNMVMSAWNALNPFTYNININNEEFEPSSNGTTVFENIKTNPLGKILDLNYYTNSNGDLQDIYQNLITDLDTKDVLNKISPDFLDNVDIAKNDTNYFMFGTDDFAGTLPIPPVYPSDTSYDVVLFNENETMTGCTPTPTLICPNNGNVPITELDFYGPTDLGLILTGATENFLNSTIENEFIYRTLGGVHNLLSVWQNGRFEGGVWNGGYWIKGVFEPYRFENYPINIIDTLGAPAVFDYFDDNIINDQTKQIDNGIWSRGIFYGGYIKADSYVVSVPAYITDNTAGQVLDLDLSTKMCLSDQDLVSIFNSDTTSILQLRSLNLVTQLTRSSIRDNSNIGDDGLFYTLMNGQMLGGYFLDRIRVNNNIANVPLIGTTASEFSNDIDINGVSKFNFGKNKVLEVQTGPVIFDTEVTSSVGPYLLKNTSDNEKVELNVASPVLYDVTNSEYTSTVITGSNANLRDITDKFYYEYYIRSLPNTQHPVPRTNIKHASTAVNGSPDWTDIDPALSNLIIPSFAQGDGNVNEPFYD